MVKFYKDSVTKELNEVVGNAQYSPSENEIEITEEEFLEIATTKKTENKAKKEKKADHDNFFKLFIEAAMEADFNTKYPEVYLWAKPLYDAGLIKDYTK